MPITSELHYTNAISQANIPPEHENIAEPKPPSTINNSPPQIIQKRKRSINPQADENFVRALEAVRFGGIGFCKAARMYGVNNRTLWLEYKKRGYPISRLSIKNRKQEFAPQPNVEEANPTAANQENEPVCVANPVALISTAFLDGRSMEMGSVLQRSRYFDTSIMNTQQQPINMGINFDQMS